MSPEPSEGSLLGEYSQPDEEKSITIAEEKPFGFLPAQHIELMAQGDDFRLAVNPRPEEPCDRTPDQPECVRHRRQASPNLRSPASQIEFAVETGLALACQARQKEAPASTDAPPLMTSCYTCRPAPMRSSRRPLRQKPS